MSRTEGSTGRSRSGCKESGNARLLCMSFMSSFSCHSAELPGDELLLADIELLADGAFARGDGNDALEDLVAHLGERGRAVDDPTAVEVHVLGHPLVHLCVGGELDRRRGTASEHRSTPGRVTDHSGPTGNDPRHRDRVVPRSVHEHESALGNRLRVLVHRAAVSYTHLRAHETGRNLVCRLLLEKKK